ncbi:NPLOC4 isoform 13, partial [Pan troglodytes]
GNEITQLARPLPVEYLIIDITTTFPKDPVYTFSISQNPFPIENRDVLGETQDFHSLATYLSQNTSSVFLDTISDFHLLLFLVTNEVMPLQDSISLLLEAVRTRNEELAQTWKRSEQWATIEQLCSSRHSPSSAFLVAGITGAHHHPQAQLAGSSQVSMSTAPSGAPHTRPLQPCGPVSTARS